jgi:hypothetical protein
MYEETDFRLHPRPFTEGMIVIYAYNNRKYVGKVLLAGFYLLLVEEMTVRREQHFIRHTDVERVRA